ncbi:molybdate-anion transporter-like [Branchiostoma floridae x Branchiostoma japonicum]
MTVKLKPQLANNMEGFVCIVFFFLSALCVGMEIMARKARPPEVSASNPIFRKFQTDYFKVYFLALLADWLQGPYLYKLYSHYGFEESQIAVLYVCGFASSVIFGTGTGVLADRYGRKKLCVCFAVVYSISCLTKLSRHYGVLILGRVLGGISTSLLFTAFESWYVYEHIETHDFPPEWLPVTFSRATFWNGILAIGAGIAANIFAGLFNFGPVAPFIMAIPLLIASGVLVSTKWNENYGTRQMRFSKLCIEGLREIVRSKRILLIGAIQSLFESCMYIFVFIWTPVLDPSGPPLGVIFSSFMICIMIGSSLFHILTTKHARLQAVHVLAISVLLALTSMVACIKSTHPHHENPTVSFLAFLLLELACGMYFPCMGYLRSRIIPEKNRASVINWFRVPLNSIACIGLMYLHNDDVLGTHKIFIICSLLLMIAMLCVLQLCIFIKNDDSLRIQIVDTDTLNGNSVQGMERDSLMSKI